jgi:hypothetical protein
MIMVGETCLHRKRFRQSKAVAEDYTPDTAKHLGFSFISGKNRFQRIFPAKKTLASHER